jgi:hypothetical protein
VKPEENADFARGGTRFVASEEQKDGQTARRLYFMC